MSISKNGQIINTLEEWLRKAPPKSLDQWVINRSAMEVARAWLAVKSPSLPKEVEVLLSTNTAFDKVDYWEGEPEVRIPFDKFAGEPRNSDLVIKANDKHGNFIIAVEAKADESFSNTIADALADALDRKLKNPRSNGILRIEYLADAILGMRHSKLPAIGKLRYQLLTSTAGALCYAKNCSAGRVILLVHEFITIKTLNENHVRNANDLSLFVWRLSQGVIKEIKQGVLYGPFYVPGSQYIPSDIQLFIGKATRSLVPHKA